MKKILFPRLSLLLLTALVWISCSKERLSSQENETGSTVTVEKSPFGNHFTHRTGIIKGAITPAGTKTIIVAYNDSYRSAEQVADIISGKFKITELPEGFYTLSVKYAFNESAKAVTFHPDMIVVGEGRQSNREHTMFLGQVSNMVLTEADCTVRISRGHEKLNDRQPRLLIGYDESPGAEAAVNMMAQRSWPSGTTATLLAVADSGVVGSIGRFVPQMKDAVIETKFVSQWGHTLAAEALATLTEAGIKASVEIVMGNAKTTIVDRADSLNADCIFVGPHCAGNSFERFLLGSDSSTVAARAHCTVEVVRAPQP